MKLSEYTIEFLGTLIAGDMDGAPYRSGPQLVAFFNQFGARDTYPAGGGFPTRRVYAQDKLRELNGNVALARVISSALDPRAFMPQSLDVESLASKVNDHLRHDGYCVVRDGVSFKVREQSGGPIRLEMSARVTHELTQAAIDDNVRKCETKLAEGDYSGAITNARSLVESVLIGIEMEYDAQAPEYDGNLAVLYKRVQRHLLLEPDRKDISDSLRQVLSGLISIVGGLAAVRNKMGDAHATSYRPSQHHAKLAVFSAVTLADFLFGTKNYQRARKNSGAPTGEAGST